MRGSYGTFAAKVESRRRGLAHMIVWALLVGAGVGGWLVPAAPAASEGAVQGSPGHPVRLVVLGDSLSAGLGLPGAAAFPARLQKALQAKGLSVDIVNAGVSGDTASGGRDRLDWSVPEGTDAVILELGANDALRGIDPDITRKALSDILTRLQARHVKVLLCGMMSPPNNGADYVARFNAIYPDLAKSFDVPLYPFFLTGVAADTKLNQADGLHPTAEGVDIIVRNMMPTVEAFLGPLTGQRS